MTISDCCPQPIFRPKVGRQPGHGDPASSRRGRPASEASRRGGSRRASHGCYSRPNFTVETAKGVRRGYRGYRGSKQPKQGRSNITGRQSDGQVSGRDGVSDSAQPTTRLRFNHDTSGRKSESSSLPACACRRQGAYEGGDITPPTGRQLGLGSGSREEKRGAE